ncbi:MAG: U32 family peptidase [Ignavibacteriae bacterium]|nr:MAG: U32 family peptidase [Ignavibacteriota bacterium]
MRTKDNNRSIELLAPAKNEESGRAAINHGADAVYIGAPKFGARLAAGNTLSDIAKLIEYAHRYWAKVYITLNTILYDDELDEARALIQSISDAGADALIIQDAGILELDLPPIPLFASTQMHNYSLEKIQFLEKVGFQRVILARELSLKQVREIRANTSIDLEFFIHGALCVSFSGQCYLSQAAQGRSANRGMCAQPCRLPYTLLDASGHILDQHKYLLSLKDLNLSEVLRDLIDCGVSSFKIEGRLKDKNYVKNVTAFYRQRIDEIIGQGGTHVKASSGNTVVSFQPDPAKTFNRGFTEHFIRRRSRDILSPDTPKSTGTVVGKVNKVGRSFFLLDASEKLHNGDGICFFNAQQELQGTNINKAEGDKIFPADMNGLDIGTVLYRNFDHAFAKELQTDSTNRFIPVMMRFEEGDNGFVLHLEDEDGVQARVSLDSPKNPAKNAQQADETIRRQLTKLGDTIFVCEELIVLWTQPYFLPVSLCNELRRRGIRMLEEERLKLYPRSLAQIQSNNIPYPVQRLDYSANVANKKAEDFYRRHGVEHIERAFELQEWTRGKTAMTMKHCLRFQYNLCTGKNVSNAEPLFLQDGRNRYRLEFDCQACQMKVILE